MKYSVFTVSTPGYTPEQLLVKLKEYGYDGVEWRVSPVDPALANEKPSYWRNNLCTIDESRALDLASEMKSLTTSYGLEICGLGSYLRCGDDPAKIENLLLAARAMGTSQLRVSPYAYDGSRNYRALFDDALKDYSLIEALAKKHGVKVVIEMHMNTIAASASAAYRIASRFDPNYIGVVYDTGNVVYEGYEDYKASLEILGEYLAHVHIKNAAWRLTGEENGVKQFKPGWAGLKTGHSDLKRFFGALKCFGYDGWVSFEDFSDEGSAEDKLRDNIRFIKEIAGQF